MAEREYWLKTDRLGFSRWTGEDLALARLLWADPEVTRLFSKIPWTADQVSDRLASEIASDREHGVQYWPMFALASGSLVGCCGIRMHEPRDRVYIFGYHLLPASWGQGFATEAAGAILDHALALPAVGSLFAGHHPDNAASRRILLKLGFVHIRDEYYEPTGAMHPSYALTREGRRAG